MAGTFRVLAQLYPTAAVETPFYVCNANSVVISSFMVCNLAGISDTLYVRICVANASNNNAQILYSNLSILGNGVLELTAGLTLANSDVIKVTSTNGTCSFQLFGQENN